MRAPVKPVAPSRTTSRLRWLVRRFRGRHDPTLPLDGTTPSIRPSDQRTPLIGRTLRLLPDQLPKDQPCRCAAPSLARHPHPRRAHRSASAPPSSPARRTAAPATPGPAVARRARGSDASPAAYTGSDLSPAGVLRRPARVVRRARRGPGRPLRVGRLPRHRLRLRRERGAAATPCAATDRPPSAARCRAVRADERRDRHQRAGGRRRRAGRRQDRRPHAVPGRGRRPGHLRRDRRRGRAARLARPARRHRRGRTEILLSGDTVVAIVAAGCRRARRPRPPPSWSPSTSPTPPRPRSRTPSSTTPPWSPPGCTTASSRLVLQAGLPDLDFDRARPAHHRVRGHPREPGRWSGDSTIEDWLPTASLDGGAEQRSSTATRSRSPTTAPRSAPSPSSASTRRRPTRPRSAAWPSTPTWPTPRPTSSTWPPARRTAAIIGGCFDCMEPFPVPEPRGLLPGWLPGGGGASTAAARSPPRAAPTTTPATSTRSTSTASTPPSPRPARWTA